MTSIDLVKLEEVSDVVVVPAVVPAVVPDVPGRYLVTVDPGAKPFTLALVKVHENGEWTFIEKIEAVLSDRTRGGRVETLTHFLSGRFELDLVAKYEGNISVICESQGASARAMDNVIYQEVLRSFCIRLGIPFTLVPPPIVSVNRKCRLTCTKSRTAKKKRTLEFYHDYVKVHLVNSDEVKVLKGLVGKALENQSHVADALVQLHFYVNE
jgi:hypothetical protein